MQGELHFVETFPNIRRDEVGTAVRNFFASVTQASNIPLREAFFRIHRGGINGMDGMARRTKDGGFHFIPIGDLMNFPWYELWFNDQFVHFSSVFRQRTGLAIRACMLARIASLSVMYREKALDRTKMPPSARYRDNILVRLKRVGADGEARREAPERAQGAYGAATGLTYTAEYALKPSTSWMLSWGGGHRVHRH